MAEYIERDALQAALQRKKAGAANGRYTDGWNDCLMRCKSMVSCFPAADVAPVRRRRELHGRWVTHYRSGTHVADGHVSTCCDMWNNRKSNYCPNCGAKMEVDNG